VARVLVVDDEADILTLVTIHLRHAGHEPLEASSGPEALKVVANAPVDVAVVDVTLPGMTGFELVEKLRAQKELRKLPIIFLSGHDEPEAVRAGRALGGEYVKKPFQAADLLSAIDRACG
jgi:DNA-binding response OmpR family regulator